MPVDSPPPNWTAVIDDIVAGRWIDPATGRPVIASSRSIVIADSLDGREAELVAAMDLGAKLAVVVDERTVEVMGRRVAKALGGVDLIILESPHADEAYVALLADRARGYDGLVAVGSGTINDLTKYVTAMDGRAYAVFGTAPAMNGYTSTTASITLASGLKVSRKARAPRGFFVDLTVNAAAPRHLLAAGLGDCLCRTTAQVDWWLAHRLTGSFYSATPFLMQAADEVELLARAGDLGRGDPTAVGYLHRVLTLCGLGVGITGTSHHGSMAEHQISHYIDCFAGDRHPGSVHGAQVGVASLTMSRLQNLVIGRAAPPIVEPTRLDEADMRRRFGDAVFARCLAEMAPKRLDAAGAAALNAKLERIWPELRAELSAMVLPTDRIHAALAAAGGPKTAGELGLDPVFYREAVGHAREIRDRYSMLDLAADAGLLDAFVAGEA